MAVSNKVSNICARKPFFAPFSLPKRHKKRGYLNRNLLIFRAETEI